MYYSESENVTKQSQALYATSFSCIEMKIKPTYYFLASLDVVE